VIKGDDTRIEERREGRPFRIFESGAALVSLGGAHRRVLTLVQWPNIILSPPGRNLVRLVA